MKKIIKKVSEFILSIVFVLLGIWIAFWAWTAVEQSWVESNMNDWQPITNNMLSAQILGYTKDSSGNKIYWRKFDTTTRTQDQASNFCREKWMVLPRMATRDSIHRNNYKWFDRDGGLKNWQSINGNWTWHWASETSSNWISAYKYWYVYTPWLAGYDLYSNWSYWQLSQPNNPYSVICVYKN